jgi:SPP1 gp7 family putative phage head morphogenesis protein
LENLYRPAIARSYGRRLKEYVTAAAADPSLVYAHYVLPPDYAVMSETAEVFTKALLLGMEPERGRGNFSDDAPVEILPFEEALAYMRKRVPVDKETYYALNDKMRYRAFTVSRLADADAVQQVQKMLADGLEQGNGLRQFLQMTEGQLADAAGLGRGMGWYYETVYRTNTATAYNAGRAIAFEEVPPIALELIGIDDTRQTEVCHSLTVPPFRRPYGDPVWDNMWPPFHFNCRTTVRGIYDESEIDEAGGPDKFYSQGAPDYTPAEGFGAYPVNKTDSWWDLTDAMRDRAEKYGLEAEFLEAKEKLIGILPNDTEGSIIDPIKNAIKAMPKNEAEVRKLGELVLEKANVEHKAVMEVLREYRDFGTEKTHVWDYATTSAKDEIVKGYQYFPTEWLEKSIAESERHPMTTYMKNRTFYNAETLEISVSYFKNYVAHELAHRMEHVIPGIVDMEKEFYERRTAGEKLVLLKDIFPDKYYEPDEKTRIDNFNHPYMGKDYGGTAYEIFSMGVEKIFFNRYNTKGDADYDSFIIGLLAGM